MNGDEIFSAIHENHRKSRTTRTVGYIVFDDQAEKLRCSMDAQARQGDTMTLLLLAAQLFVLVTAAVVALA